MCVFQQLICLQYTVVYPFTVLWSMYVCMYVYLPSNTRIYMCITVYTHGLCEHNMQIYNDVHMSRNHRTHCVWITQCCCFHFVCNLFRHGPRSRSQISWCGDPWKAEREAVWMLKKYIPLDTGCSWLEVLSFFLFKGNIFSSGQFIETFSEVHPKLWL